MSLPARSGMGELEPDLGSRAHDRAAFIEARERQRLLYRKRVAETPVPAAA
jgi:hypothetical protein